jgi:3-hydroxyacyl-CoA dehydrogenase/enoyl-CoA hydratase/carnithine racemase
VTIDAPGQAMNTWSKANMADFDVLMEDLQKEKNIKGLIFISGKPITFFAGADLNVFTQLDTEEQMDGYVGEFHAVINKLASLTYPTLAAVHGHCLGGGLEFTLVCTARIVKEGKTTVIGLPECGLGLFPGGGGTQRLPRLIGYPAIDLVVKSPTMDAKKAVEMGIMDRFVPADGDLLAEAKKFMAEILSGKADLKRPTQDFSQIDEMIAKAKQEVIKIDRGRQIPGKMLALDAIQRGVKVSLAEGAAIERANFVKAALSKEAQGNINTFFIKGATDKPQAMMTKGFKPKELKCVAVLGFGTMGRGIIIDILRNTQIQVLVKDIPEAIEPGKAFVQKILEGMAAKKRLKEPADAVMARLTCVTDYTADFQKADLVVEAVFEDIKVKEQVYKELSKAIRPDCLVSSNTSYIPITKMAGFVSNPERFGGTHFFSPVWMMELVEIVRGTQTSQDTIDNLLNIAALIKKRPIVCNDYSGFVVNAMLFPYFSFMYQCMEEGNPIPTIDKAMTDFGMPVGPIRLTDEVGIDILQKTFAAQGGHETLDNIVVKDGRLGLKKNGRGFFLADGSVDPTVLPLIKKRPPVIRTEEEIRQGGLEAMVKVGKKLLDEKVVSDVRMIDVGCIWGTGFPGFTGGPMKWADLTGMSNKLFGKKFY